MASSPNAKFTLAFSRDYPSDGRLRTASEQDRNLHGCWAQRAEPVISDVRQTGEVSGEKRTGTGI